jgi:CheY-like chemotaxis protein
MYDDSARPVVLVAEDEPELRELYAEWLSDAYDVRTATDGEGTLSALDAAVDVLFLDRRMPGLTGDEVLDVIEDRSLSCRVAMVTAVEPDFDIVDLPVDDYLVKPVSAVDLRETAERLLTQETYSDAIQEYYSLLSKKAALESRKTREDLADSDAYAQLLEEIDALEAETDLIRDDLAEANFESVLRDL